MSDEDLRARFEALRREEERTAPDFHQTVAAARARRRERRGPRLRLWAPALAAGAVVLALLLARPTPEPPALDWSPDRWAMPTDVLLELPGAELLRGAPDIGTSSPFEPPARSGALRRPLA